jgi:hypothetical protein
MSIAGVTGTSSVATARRRLWQMPPHPPVPTSDDAKAAVDTTA